MRSQLSFHCSRSNSTVTAAFSVYTVEAEERNSFLKTKLIISETIHSGTNRLSYLTAMALRLNANIKVNDADQPIYLAYRKITPLQLQTSINTEKIKRQDKRGYHMPSLPQTTSMILCKLLTVLCAAVCNLYSCYHCMMVASNRLWFERLWVQINLLAV